MMAGAFLASVTVSVTTMSQSVFAESQIWTEQEKLATLEDHRSFMCERIKNRIKKIVERYDLGKERRVNRFKKIIGRLENIIEKLKEGGRDTSKLEEDLENLNGMVEEFDQKYEKYIGALRKTLEYKCGESGGMFRKKMKEARKYRMEVRDKAVEIKRFLLDTVLPHLRKLKNSINETFPENLELQKRSDAGQDVYWLKETHRLTDYIQVVTDSC